MIRLMRRGGVWYLVRAGPVHVDPDEEVGAVHRVQRVVDGSGTTAAAVFVAAPHEMPRFDIEGASIAVYPEVGAPGTATNSRMAFDRVAGP